jgi:probable DNA repair protein
MTVFDLAEALGLGATLVTPNNRLARTLVTRHDAGMARAGHRTWSAARALPWSAWLTALWREASDAQAIVPAARLLAPVESAFLWHRLVTADGIARSPLLDPQGAAALAGDAWALVHAWGAGGESWRAWRSVAGTPDDSDPAMFAAWAEQYRRELERLGAVDLALVPDILARVAPAVPEWRGREVVLAGFIETTPQQRRLSDALAAAGMAIRTLPSVAGTASPMRFSAATTRDELRAALVWARRQVAAEPACSVGIAIEDLAQRRDEVRALAEDVLCPALQLPGNAAAPRPYDLSLGTPLADAPIVAAALALVSLAQGPLARAAAAGLLRSPYFPGSWQARAACEREWLDESRAQVRWDDALASLGRFDIALAARWRTAREGSRRPAPQSPRQWASHWRGLLERCGWPGSKSLTATEFAARNAWEELLEEFARIGALDTRMTGATALSAVSQLARRSIFQPKTPPAAISILGILEAAGLPFDALWVAGLSAQRWPPAPQPNAFLPIAWQRDRNVPRSSAARELAYARALTTTLIQAAPRVVLSHPETLDGERSAPSALTDTQAPMLEEDLGAPDSAEVIAGARRCESIADERAPALAAGKVRGGASVVAAQSDCPFRATARHRMRVEPWPEAAEGLNARERGQLVHAAMAAFWRDVGTHAALRACDDIALRQRVDRAVESALPTLTPARWRLLPPALAAAETARIANIAVQWIEECERPRPGFAATNVEWSLPLEIAGLTLTLKLDRVDTLDNGGHAIIDYKTGAVELPSMWFAQRPRAPQLGLYALALKAQSPAIALKAAAYAKLKVGEIGPIGLVAEKDAWPDLTAVAKLREPNTWADVEQRWRTQLTSLAVELRDGVATVTPRDNGAPCRTCGLQPLCRIEAADHTLAIDDDWDDCWRATSRTRAALDVRQSPSCSRGIGKTEFLIQVIWRCWASSNARACWP